MWLGILLALGASACWALANVAIQRAARDVGPVRALLWSQLSTGVLVAAAAPVFDERTAPVTGGVLAWGAVAGVAALLAYSALFIAFERARLSVAVPIMSSWSLIAAGISMGIFGERVRSGQMLGAACVVAGVLCVALAEGRAADRQASPHRAGGLSRRGVLWASFGAAVGFGVLVPAIDRIAPAFGRIGSVGAVYALDLALGLPVALALGQSLRWPSRKHWPVVFAAGLFETVGFVCISLAATKAPVALVSPVASLSSAMTILYATLVLRERPDRWVAIGAALACGGVVLLAT